MFHAASDRMCQEIQIVVTSRHVCVIQVRDMRESCLACLMESRPLEKRLRPCLQDLVKQMIRCKQDQRVRMNLLLPFCDASLQLILYPKAERRSYLSRSTDEHTEEQEMITWILDQATTLSGEKEDHIVLHCSLPVTDLFIDLVLQKQLAHAIWKKNEVLSFQLAWYFAAMGCSRSKPLDIHEMPSFPSNLMIFVRDDHSRTVEQMKLRRDLHKVQFG